MLVEQNSTDFVHTLLLSHLHQSVSEARPSDLNLAEPSSSPLSLLPHVRFCSRLFFLARTLFVGTWFSVGVGGGGTSQHRAERKSNERDSGGRAPTEEGSGRPVE